MPTCPVPDRTGDGAPEACNGLSIRRPGRQTILARAVGQALEPRAITVDQIDIPVSVAFGHEGNAGAMGRRAHILRIAGQRPRSLGARFGRHEYQAALSRHALIVTARISDMVLASLGCAQGQGTVGILANSLIGIDPGISTTSPLSIDLCQQGVGVRILSPTPT